MRIDFSGKEGHVGRLRALVTAALFCALSWALAACDDEPTPEIADPTPSSTSTSASPTETESSPTTSPTAEALTPEETVKAWVAARNQALQDGDTSALRALSVDPCETCEQHIAPIEGVFAAGGSFATQGWTVDSLTRDGKVGAEVRLNAAVTMAAGETVQATGQDPVKYPEDKRIMVFRVLSDSDGSRVAFVGYIS